MKSFLSLILEDEIGIYGNLDDEGKPRQGDILKGKFTDKKKAMSNWEKFEKALGPNVDATKSSVPTPEALADKLAQGKAASKPASKSTKSVDDILQRNLAKAGKQFDDMLDKAGIKPEKLQQGIDPHSGQLDATRAAKSEAKTATRKVAKEMKSAAKLTPQDLAKLKKLEDMPGMQRSFGMLGKDDLDSARRQVHFDKWGGKSHMTPTKVSAAGSQGKVKSVPKAQPAPRTPPLFDPETHLSVKPTSGSLQAQSRAINTAIKQAKRPGFIKQAILTAKAAMKSPVTSTSLKVGGKAAGLAGLALAPVAAVSDANTIADMKTKGESDDIAAAKQRGENPYSAQGTRDRAQRRTMLETQWTTVE